MTEVDPPNATRAPESDAAAAAAAPTATGADQSTAAAEPIIPGDTPAQTGPTMGEHCVTDRPSPSGKTGSGETRKLGGVDTYISKPSEYPHAPARLLLLLTGGTGIQSTNNQIQADKFASEGFLVVMPDLFEGDAFPNATTAPEEGLSLLDQIKLKAAEAAKSFMIDMWSARHTEEKVMPILHKVIDACKEEFADAISHGSGIYAAGYCFGGRYVILLASERAGAAGSDSRTTTASEPLIKVGSLAHPSMVTMEDFVSVKSPLGLVCVENDPMFSDEVRTAMEDHLSKNNLEHEVQVYPGVPHGFAVVGEYDDLNIKNAQETAYEQMLKWLKDH
ncbi:hypothetical protein MCOR14_001460 [Pyricularia oryzae]|nr:hypothetical protein MCOR14_001460 [Pyricularia oryzae]